MFLFIRPSGRHRGPQKHGPDKTDLFDPKFAKEVELNRAAKGWAEHLFRFSLYYFFTFVFLNLLRLTIYRGDFEKHMGKLGQAMGIIFLLSFFYMLNYMVLRYVKSLLIKIAWWAMIGIIGISIVGVLLFK